MSWIKKLVTPRPESGGILTGPGDGLERKRLLDALVGSHDSWRKQCAAVQSAYDRWLAGRDESGVAFAIYRAELEFEEQAARAYRDSAKRLALATRRAPRGHH